MEIFLIILGIYLITLLIIFIGSYIDWISDKNSKGTTLNDFYYWMAGNPVSAEVNYFFVFLLWCPFINTVVAIFELLFELFNLFGRLLKNTIGKINIR